MNARASHVGLCVSDLERSVRFFCDGLGFELAHRFDLDSEQLRGLDRSLEVDGHVVVTSQFIRLPGMAIELLHYEEPVPHGAPSSSRSSLGLTHLALHVDDLDAAIARAVDHGATVLEHTRANLGVELVFLSDPDGNRIELMQRS